MSDISSSGGKQLHYLRGNIVLETTQKTESFGQALKYWRKTKNKSQMDLALDADISTRHLSFLENGRANPSREMVIKLAAILGLPYRHQNTLLTRAGFAPVFNKEPLDSPNMAMIKASMQRLLDNHSPYPAMIVDSSYKILMSNAGFQAFVRFFASDAALQKYDNALALLFAEDGLKPYVEDWPTIEQFMLMRIREEVLAQQSPELMAVYKQISEGITLGDPLTLKMDYKLPVMTLTVAKGDIRASFFTTIATLGTPLDLTTQELRIEMLFPADEHSKMLMENVPC